MMGEPQEPSQRAAIQAEVARILESAAGSVRGSQSMEGTPLDARCPNRGDAVELRFNVERGAPLIAVSAARPDT